MSKSMWMITSALLVVAIADGQGLETPKHTLPHAGLSTAPVTCAEAKAVFTTMEQRLSRGVHLTSVAPPSEIPNSSVPVSRSQVVREFNRVFQKYKFEFKFTPPKVRFDATQITLNDPAEKPALLNLISWGMIAKIGPIAAGAGPNLTVHQFGDAVGFFMSRVADLTHMPLSRWTPYLNGGRG